MNLKRNLCLLLISMFCASVAVAGEAAQPDTAVGTSWTFKRVDMDTNSVQRNYALVVAGKTDSLYDIVAYDFSGGVRGKEIQRFSLTKNLGQGSPTPNGKIGDGNRFQFPLKVGSSWKTVDYWSRVWSGAAAGRNEGYDTVTYTVASQEERTVDAGKFVVFKIVGKGRWSNTTQGWQGPLDIVVYYSPAAQAAVRTEIVTTYEGNNYPPTRNAIELVSMDIK